MTKTGGARHLKRHGAPRHWPIHRKDYKFTVRPIPGAHAKENSIPLLILIRDYLKLATNRSEAVRILNRRQVLVDGRVRTSPGYGAGYMDIVSFPKISKHYRIVYTKSGLRPVEIPADEANYKICGIRNKTLIKGGKLQLNLHDGRNVLVEKDVYSTKQSVRVGVPDQTLGDVYPLEVGATVQVTSGRHMGKIGIIRNITQRFGPKASTVVLETSDGSEVQTALDYVFVVGAKKPEVTLEQT